MSTRTTIRCRTRVQASLCRAWFAARDIGARQDNVHVHVDLDEADELVDVAIDRYGFTA